MEITLLHAHYNADHLAKVVAEMQVLGAPTIKAVMTAHGIWQALEGAHRLRAAAQLGLTPIIDEVELLSEEDLERTLESLGLDAQDGITIADCLDVCTERGSVTLTF